jgi:hypothetical protein
MAGAARDARRCRDGSRLDAAHVVKGGVEGNVVFEYDARSGRRLAAAERGIVTYSVAGAGLTAVPGGAWASFRTGLLGLTIHLAKRDLAMIAPPGAAVAQRGKARAIERVPPDRLVEPLAADPATRRLFAAEARGLVVITPPRRCWR